MESVAVSGVSLVGKGPLRQSKVSGGGPVEVVVRQSHTRVEREEFLAVVGRLGSVCAAARELGINRSTGQKWAKAAGITRLRRHSVADKALFFSALARAGNIADAAAELGVNINTARGWARQVRPAGASTRVEGSVGVRSSLAHNFEVVEEFLAALAQIGTVSVAARKLGLNESTCYRWAAQAGMASIRPIQNSEKQLRYLTLRRDGVNGKDAALAVGANRENSLRWEQQLRARDLSTGQDDGVDLPYNQEVRNTVFEPVAPAPQPPASSALEETSWALERPISSRYLSLPERERIADLLVRGKSIRTIARDLGRSPGSISREISRRGHPTLGYLPYGAHRSATLARARPKNSKLATSGPLREHVKAKLEMRWSPMQISNTLVKEFPNDPLMRVSHETIYQALYLQARGGLKREVKEALRTGRTRRKKHRNGEERRPRFRDPMINISERPAEVTDRAVPGHWEGDLITGTNNQSAIATLVERTTRYTMLVHLPADHNAESVRDALIKTMTTLPSHLRGSLTWDQGVEMSKHKAFSIATDMDVYFCDPHSPWQRGSNENTNGLLRQYFPKGTDLGAYGPEDLEHVAQELNARPRKTLNWNTPAEQLHDLLITN